MAALWVHLIYGIPSILLYLAVFAVKLTSRDGNLSGPFNTIFLTAAAVVSLVLCLIEKHSRTYSLI